MILSLCRTRLFSFVLPGISHVAVEQYYISFKSWCIHFYVFRNYFLYIIKHAPLTPLIVPIPHTHITLQTFCHTLLAVHDFLYQKSVMFWVVFFLLYICVYATLQRLKPKTKTHYKTRSYIICFAENVKSHRMNKTLACQLFIIFQCF